MSGARQTARPVLCTAIALLLASCEDRPSRHAGTAASSSAAVPSAPLAAAPAPSVSPQGHQAEGPVLSAPELVDLPGGFTHAFSHPDDDVEYRFDGGTCSVLAHGRLGQAPVRAVVAAAGLVLTVELEIVGTSERLVYRGELANTPCADRVSENRGVLHAAKGTARTRRYPARLFVSLERTPGIPETELPPRMSLTGRSAGDQTVNALELSETKPYLRRAYDALARPLFLHEKSPVDIENATEDDKGMVLVAYRLPNRELKLAELSEPRRVVRRSIKTGLACVAPDCRSGVSGARPRPGIALVIATNTSWDCTAQCTATREIELWTLTARGFLFTGKIPATRVPTDAREREASTSLRWVYVDGGSDLALLVGMHPRPRETSQLWLFTFDARLQRFVLDGRDFGPSPEDSLIPPGLVRFGL